MNLDSYGHNNSKFRFYRFYFHNIQELNVPKFDIINVVNVCPYQDYPNILKNFIIVEKAVIAYVYPVISIFKLKPSGLSFSTLY